MRVEKITRNLFEFDELSTDAQIKALDALRDINLDDDWWDSVYDDANTIGLTITEFDIDHGTIDGRLGFYPKDVANLILSKHGPETDTFKLANEYLTTLDTTLDDELADLDQNFKYDLLECYLVMLRQEYEYLTSDEAIKHLIEVNGFTYEFDEEGKRS